MYGLRLGFVCIGRQCINEAYLEMYSVFDMKHHMLPFVFLTSVLLSIVLCETVPADRYPMHRFSIYQLTYQSGYGGFPTTHYRQHLSRYYRYQNAL